MTRTLIAILLALQLQAVLAAEAPVDEEIEVWLVSYGPGEIYWQRFGHNGIWIRWPRTGLDHVFNFGFFDFEQEDFFLRFLQGRMLYFSAARPVREEFAAYINEDRSIRAQKLDLSFERKLELSEFLLNEVRPENRDYLYDYYLNNCATRVRDALDLAVDGRLRSEFSPLAAPLNWRDHTRRLTQDDFWLYLGLQIVLGAPVDRPISRWEEMFIPQTLAEAVSSTASSRNGAAHPLVTEDVVIYESSLKPPPAAPGVRWPLYLLASLGVIAAGWLAMRLLGPRLAIALASAWLLLAGMAGLAMAFFWLGTDHAVARSNLNLLVLNPLFLPLAFWRGRERFALPLVAAVSALALLAVLLPGSQYSLDVLAAFLPFNLAAALLVHRTGRSRGPKVGEAERP